MSDTSGVFDHPNAPREGLAEKAYLIIRDRILKGQLRLGAPLSRRKLASELGMSLLPVAEALQRLEGDGLVESRARVGTRVFLPTAEEIREQYEIREALESQAARLFAVRATVRQQMELLRMAESMDAMFNRCTEGETDAEFLFAIQSFHSDLHLRIAEMTGCRALRQTIEKNQVLIFNWAFDVAAHRPQLPRRFHRDLMDALCKGDPEAADAAMRDHIRYGMGSVVRAISHVPASTRARVRRERTWVRENSRAQAHEPSTTP